MNTFDFSFEDPLTFGREPYGDTRFLVGRPSDHSAAEASTRRLELEQLLISKLPLAGDDPLVDSSFASYVNGYLATYSST